MDENYSTEKTAITNEMASVPGFPAQTIDGETVNIVSKVVDGQGRTLLTDADGTQYVQQTDAPRLLVPAVEDGVYEGEELSAPVPASAPAEEADEEDAA